MCLQGIKPGNVIWIEPTKAGQVVIVDITLPKKDVSYLMPKETPYVVRRSPSSAATTTTKTNVTYSVLRLST